MKEYPRGHCFSGTELVYWILVLILGILFTLSILLSWSMMASIWLGLFWAIAVLLLAWIVG